MYRPLKGVLSTMVWQGHRLLGPRGGDRARRGHGKTLWEHVYEAPLLSDMGMEYGPGPHSTPLVAGDLVFAPGVTGKLHALDKKTGRVAWSHDLWRDIGGKEQGRGYSCSPLAYGSNGDPDAGRPRPGVVAFRQKTGKVAWKNTNLDPARLRR